VLAIGKAEGGEEEGQTTECVEVWVHELNSKGREETKLTRTVYSHKKKNGNKPGSARRMREGIVSR